MSKIEQFRQPKIQTEVVCRCPYCAKPNPEIESKCLAETENSMMAGIILTCCKKLLNCQLIPKPRVQVNEQGERVTGSGIIIPR